MPALGEGHVLVQANFGMSRAGAVVVGLNISHSTLFFHFDIAQSNSCFPTILPIQITAMTRRVLLYAPLLLLSIVSPMTSAADFASPAAPPVPGAEAPCLSSMDVVNRTARLTLCMQGRKVWKERRNNDRTTQVFATIINTGESQVCNLHVEVSNMTKALRWWPTWFNTTAYPYFALSPGQTVSVGAVVPQAKGFPVIKITQMRPCDGESPPLDDEESPMTNETGGDHASSNEDPPGNATTTTTRKPTATPGLTTTPTPPAPATPAKAVVAEGGYKAITAAKPAAAAPAPAPATPAPPAEPKPAADPKADPKAAAPADDAVEEVEGKEDDEIPSALTGKKKCEVVKGLHGLQARWCVDLSPKVWVEPKRKKRYVRVVGEATNLESNVSLCNMEFWVESNKSAVSTWPDWWPNSGVEQLDPGNSFVVGANIHYKKGVPKIKLVSFSECVDTGALPEDPLAAAPAGAGTGVNGGWNAGGGGGGGGAPASSPWQPLAQQQGGGQQWQAPAPAPAPVTTDFNAANNNNNNNWNNGGGGGGGGGGGDGGNQWHV